MKKLCALLLSVMMAASLAVPAFAAPAPDAPPEEAVPISAILDGDLGIIGGVDGPTSIFTTIDDEADWDSWLEETMKAYHDQRKVELGGVAGQIGVMVNGAYIKFTDAVPEVTGGRTMTPVRALIEALGGKAGYDGKEILCELDGLTLTFTVGSKDVAVKLADGQTGTISMDCAPYIKGGRTYVPVRFIGEALGYEVGWDSDYQTAVLLDREVLAAEIDKDFTILNKVQAGRGPILEEGKDYRTDVEGSVTFTAFDTLNGSKTYKADVTLEELFNDQAASGGLSIELSDNVMDALMELTVGEGWEEYEEAAALRTILEGLTDMEFILTREGLVWVHAPALDELGGAEDVWCGLALGAELGELAFTGVGTATVGSLLATAVDVDSVPDWSSAMELVQMLAAFYGDDCFTTANGVSTLSIGLDDLEELYAGYMGDDLDVKSTYKEYQFTMTVDSKGGTTITCKAETTAQSGMPAMKLSMDAAQSAGKLSLTMDLHVSNLGEMKLTLEAAQTVTSEKPMSEPPADAIVVDAAELLDT